MYGFAGCRFADNLIYLVISRSPPHSRPSRPADTHRLPSENHPYITYRYTESEPPRPHVPSEYRPTQTRRDTLIYSPHTDDTMTEDGPPRPQAGDGVNKQQLAVKSVDPAIAFHAVAADYEERAEIYYDRVEELDPETDRDAWLQCKGMLDAYRSAAVTARTAAFAWDARDRGPGREEVSKS